MLRNKHKPIRKEQVIFMKRSFRILAMAMAIVLAVGLNAGSAGAKSIYFAGKYRVPNGPVLKMNEYSSPEGKEVGNFKLDPIAHTYLSVKGTLKKTGTANTYVCNKKGSIFTFKVYSNKVTVKMNNKAKKNYLNFSGTYKLKQRYEMP